MSYRQQKRWEGYGLQKLHLGFSELACGDGVLRERLEAAWERGLGEVTESQMPTDQLILELAKFRKHFLDPSSVGLTGDGTVCQRLDELPEATVRMIADDAYILCTKVIAAHAVLGSEDLTE